jgi:hypothetical protein
MEIASEDTPELTVTDPEMRQLLGMFEVPAFARRGQDLEFLLARLVDRLLRERARMLEMVRLRIRQWTTVAISSVDGSELFSRPIDELILLVLNVPPNWAASPGPKRKRIVVARDLIASVDRFNRRWNRFLQELNLEPFNARIDDYNRYYLLEKECAFGSAKVAARGFQEMSRLTVEGLLEDHPLLPVL